MLLRKFSARTLRIFLALSTPFLIAPGPTAHQADEPMVFDVGSPTGLHSIHLPFTLDFSVSPTGEVRVIEFGDFYSSRYDGYKEAYPQYPGPGKLLFQSYADFAKQFGYSYPLSPQYTLQEWHAYEAARDAWYEGSPIPKGNKATFEANNAMIFVAGFDPYSKQELARKKNPNALIFGITQDWEPVHQLVGNKAYSTLLDSPETSAVRPAQMIVNPGMASNQTQIAELQAAIQEFPGDQLILKSSIGTRGEEIYLTTKDKLPLFLKELSERETKRADGRISTARLFEGIFGNETLMKHGKKLNFEDKHGGTVTPQLRESILRQLGPFMKTAFLRAAAVNEHGLSESNPISNQVRTDLSNQPKFHQHSFSLLKEGTRLSTTVTEFVTGTEDPLAALARECIERVKSKE